MTDDLTEEERAAADAAVARFRAERDVAAAGGDLGFGIERAARDDTAAADQWRDEHTDPIEELVAQQDVRDAEDFTAFWSASRRRQGKTLRNVVPGVDVTLPAELPLAFEVQSRAMANDRTLAAVHRLFGMLYGRDTLRDLIAGGLTGEQLSVLIVWGSVNGNGQDMTLAEAAAKFEELRAKDSARGKAPGPSGSGGTSSTAGPSSKPTSRANTRKKKKR